MAMIEKHLSEPQEIELLLPWYEKGTLSAAETRRVESALAADPELRVRLELIREEAVEAVFAAERLGMPGADARFRLMDQIAKEAGLEPVASRGIVSRLLGLLPASLPPAFALAGAAAIVIIAVQFAVLVTMMGRDPAYTVASGDQPAAAGGTFLLVRFKESANAGQIAELLRAIGGMIVDGPKPGGTFKVKISGKVIPDAKQDEILATLREKSDIVSYAAPTQ
jgi:hypothetical protein